MELTTKEIIEEVIRRRDCAREEKTECGKAPAEIANHPIILKAYNFYRGIEYELNNLLEWLGYEE